MTTRTNRRTRLALLVAACVSYLWAAWMVAPGFYDGFTTSPSPYAWTCPPAHLGANTKPASAHVDINVVRGISDADSAYTSDSQFVIGFLPGAFDAGGRRTVSVDVSPSPDCPRPPGVQLVTNAYGVTADATLVKDAEVTLLYSNLEAPPSDIYTASTVDGPWRSIGAQPQAQPYTIWQKTPDLGYFAAGYPSGSAAPSGPPVGIVAAVLIGFVILAGVALALARRRRPAAEEDGDDAI